MSTYLPTVFGENLMDMFDDFDRSFFRGFGNVDRALYGKHAQNMMKTDVRETDEGYEVDVDLPGFSKDEIHLELNSGYLTIATEKSLEKHGEAKNGKLLRQESIVDYTKENIVGQYASLDGFIREWSAQQKKETIRDLLKERGIDLDAMKAEQGMEDVDDFDFICHVAFDAKPLTRRERANNVKKRDFLSRYTGAAREVLEALLDRYMNTGVYEIEKTEILKLDPFKRMGKPARLAALFGGKDGYLKAVRELEEEIYRIG